MMSRGLFGVTFCADRPPANFLRQPIHAVALENPVYAGIGDLYAVIPLHVPYDPYGSQVIFPSQMKDLLLDFGRSSEG
jgi:hypothetical protein